MTVGGLSRPGIKFPYLWGGHLYKGKRFITRSGSYRGLNVR